MCLLNDTVRYQNFDVQARKVWQSFCDLVMFSRCPQKCACLSTYHLSICPSSSSLSMDEQVETPYSEWSLSLTISLCYATRHILCVLCAQQFSHVTLCDKSPLSMGFHRQEYWSRLPFPPLGDLSDSGIKLASLIFPALAGGFFTTSGTWDAPRQILPVLKYMKDDDIKENLCGPRGPSRRNASVQNFENFLKVKLSQNCMLPQKVVDSLF